MIVIPLDYKVQGGGIGFTGEECCHCIHQSLVTSAGTKSFVNPQINVCLNVIKSELYIIYSMT